MRAGYCIIFGPLILCSRSCVGRCRCNAALTLLQQGHTKGTNKHDILSCLEYLESTMFEVMFGVFRGQFGLTHAPALELLRQRGIKQVPLHAGARKHALERKLERVHA